jgi:hypothetical protein
MGSKTRKHKGIRIFFRTPVFRLQKMFGPPVTVSAKAQEEIIAALSKRLSPKAKRRLLEEIVNAVTNFREYRRGAVGIYDRVLDVWTPDREKKLKNIYDAANALRSAVLDGQKDPVIPNRFFSPPFSSFTSLQTLVKLAWNMAKEAYESERQMFSATKMPKDLGFNLFISALAESWTRAMRQGFTRSKNKTDSPLHFISIVYKHFSSELGSDFDEKRIMSAINWAIEVREAAEKEKQMAENTVPARPVQSPDEKQEPS